MHKAQMSIFIIIAIVLVIGVVLLLIVKGVDIPGVGLGKEVNPNIFMKSCLEDKVKESVELISVQGGYAEPDFYKNFSFTNEDFFRKISYLCYTSNNYFPCINHEPLLIQHLKDEIQNYISEDVSNCFSDLVTTLEDNGYVVNSEYNGFDVELMEEKVIININGELILTKSGETEKKENFKIIVPSKFYDIALVVQEIISQEAEYCNFDTLGFMSLYPKFNINKLRTSDLETIYTVEHRDTEEKFIFAVRSCVIPPGI